MKLADLLLEMPPEVVEDIEQEFKRKFLKLGIMLNFTKHFTNRISDTTDDAEGHSRDEISEEELRDLFNRVERKHGELFKLAKEFDDELKRGEFEGVIRQELKNINVPFALAFKKNLGRFVLTCKTILKKKAAFVNRDTDHVIEV